jgi:hypothetical protein
LITLNPLDRDYLTLILLKVIRIKRYVFSSASFNYLAIQRREIPMLNKLSIVAASAISIVLGVGDATLAASFQVVANNLDSPRGLTFGSDGALYVVEAGRGGTSPCIPAPGAGPDGPQVCYGATGGITRIQNGLQERILTGLPSVALPIQIPDTDITITIDATGAHDLKFDSNGKPYLLIGLGSSPQRRDDILQVPAFGQLVALDSLTGTAFLTPIADLAQYEGLNNPDDQGPSFFNPYNEGIDSNPYSFLIQGDSAYIVDAAGNDFFRAKLDGSELTLLSVFPARLATDPFTGQTIGLQSVPTSVALGPDGAFYVSEFTGFPYQKGAARIFRIGSDNQPTVYAEDFTHIIDFDFDNRGGLYVLEYAAEPLFPPAFPNYGQLLYVDPNGTRNIISSGELLFPTALELGPDGDIYVSNQGYIPGIGEVLRFSNPYVSVPEPTLALGLLAFGVIGFVAPSSKKANKGSKA